ncbi:MAG: 16S rRNA (cytosine(1402)-N(4))-methyltransferase RsmH [Campylobacteraceae bacterium]|nr:16S rRNA (cytosine(1402)-N(4))-methyltransferase RsmH [Campylobacteraceae bacterium]
MHSPHISVLMDEVLEIFKDLDEGYFIDCTLGFAGHSEAILNAHPNLHLIGCDKDENALSFSKKRLEKFGDRVSFYKGAFSSVLENFKDKNIVGLLADIGVSSWQLDEKTRGFGFDSDSLDMRMDLGQDLNAKDVINTYSADELGEIFRDYGEISQWRNIANEIVQRRKKSPIQTPRELLDILGNTKERGRKVSVATLVFQAIRIEVNDELGELNRLLDSLEKLNPKGARVGIISFHSLEDRIVKKTYKQWEKSCICPPEYMRCVCKIFIAFSFVSTFFSNLWYYIISYFRTIYEIFIFSSFCFHFTCKPSYMCL